MSDISAQLLQMAGVRPQIAPNAFVAPGAYLIGRVVLADSSSVWFNAVLRGDNEPIVIGHGSNVQDLTMIHTDPGYAVKVGRNVTIGHRAILHGCEVEDGALVGMGAIILNGARIGRGALVGAGALVPEGAEIPAGHLALGVPARVVRPLSEQEQQGLLDAAARYAQRAQRYIQTLAGS